MKKKGIPVNSWKFVHGYVMYSKPYNFNVQNIFDLTDYSQTDKHKNTVCEFCTNREE